MTIGARTFSTIGLCALVLLAGCKPPPTETKARDDTAMSGHDMHAGHDGMAGMEGMDMASIPANATPATRAFIFANATMHKDMAITYSGDADRDFMQGMIPHHQGAVAMARIVLEHGKDPQVRKLALDVIAAQEKEIAQMNAWLEKPPAPVPASPTK
jgi:uncharacterized protein (DUF305 family)